MPLDSVHLRVTRPGDPGWDAARRSWNLSVDQHPAAVVEAAGADEISAAVRYAAREGLRVAPQATGHGSEALGPLEGAVLLKTSAMRAIAIDPAARTIRVEAGVTAGEAGAAAAAHGLAPSLGVATTVGVAGLALGGGTGWLSRTHGLSANTIRALEVVTADGEQRRVDARTEPELFWALRGSGGRVAIVTALELELFPVAELYGGAAFWPAERAAEVLERYREWSADLPEATGAMLRTLAMPPIDAVPPPLRGRRVVAVIAVHHGPAADGARLVQPLRDLGDPLVDTFGPVAAADLGRVAGDPEEPIPARGDGWMVGPLDPGLTDTLAELVAGDALAPLMVVELRLLGGALSRAPEGHGALARLDGAYSVFATGVVAGPGAAAAIDERLAELRAHFAPWTTPQELLNVSLGGDPSAAFDAATWARLGRAREAYDPDGLILHNHAG